MKVTKGELLVQADVEFPVDKYPYARQGWEMIDGYVTEVVVGMGDHSTTEYMLVLEREGSLWGFVDWSHDEVGTGWSNDMDDSTVIELRPVEIVNKPTYQFADPRKPRILWAFALAIVCNLRWEVRDEEAQDELWIWFPYDDPNLLAAGFEDAFIVTNIPLELSPGTTRC